MAITFDQLEAHKQDLARRQKVREEKSETLLRCMDPAFAAGCEMQKPHYKFTVECEWWALANTSTTAKKHHPMEVHDDETGATERMERRSEKRTVVAQSEQDAWAIFCDSIQEWPSPRSPGMVRKFTRGKQVDQQKLLTLLQAQTATVVRW